MMVDWDEPRVELLKRLWISGKPPARSLKSSVETSREMQ